MKKLIHKYGIMLNHKEQRILNTVIVLIIIGLALSCTENYTSKYDSYDDLIKSSDLSKGWVPEIIPNDSKNIIETHNIDNNRIFGYFDFSNNSFIDSLEEYNKMQTVDSVINNLRQTKRPKRPSWFISELNLISLKPIIFRHSEFYIICDTINKKGYFLR